MTSTGFSWARRGGCESPTEENEGAVRAATDWAGWALVRPPICSLNRATLDSTVWTRSPSASRPEVMRAPRRCSIALGSFCACAGNFAALGKAGLWPGVMAMDALASSAPSSGMMCFASFCNLRERCRTSINRSVWSLLKPFPSALSCLTRSMNWTIDICPVPSASKTSKTLFAKRLRPTGMSKTWKCAWTSFEAHTSMNSVMSTVPSPVVSASWKIFLRTPSSCFCARSFAFSIFRASSWVALMMWSTNTPTTKFIVPNVVLYKKTTMNPIM
mmetsp:Transcript_25723/g.77451  ORF Transcript_25723/g.77451 Transcript_25723/m.77451 type:complete len:273 (-) Transcript_25723:294-1112(-)